MPQASAPHQFLEQLAERDFERLQAALAPDPRARFLLPGEDQLAARVSIVGAVRIVEEVFAGAEGEGNAHRYGTYAYSIRGRKPGWP